MGRQFGGPSEWRQAAGNGVTWQLPGQGGGGGGTFGHYGPAQSAGQQFGGLTTPRKHDEIPNKIRNVLGPLIQDCIEATRGEFCFRHLLKVGRLKFRDLPRLRNYEGAEGSAICYAGLLGRCPLNDSSCKFRRVMPSDLVDPFVEEFVRVVKPPFELCLQAFRRPPGANSGGRLF